jgi:hypothetical protein
MVITAQHPEAERAGARICVEERFLFDRINRDASRITVRNKKNAILIHANMTNTFAALRDLTTVTTCEALKPSVRQLLNEFTAC